MSEPNPYISNGTCYTAAGQKLDGSFIPCGNDAFGHQTCCGAGDNCLADNACFGVHGSGYGSYLTYWAGCTDPNYDSATCPRKDVDQPWVALTLCDNSNGEWAICSQAGNPSTLQPGSYCSCTNAASVTVAFSDSTTLTSICSLPKSTGQSIQFFVGHFPSSSLTSGSPAPSQSSTPASTSPPASSSAASSSPTATSGPTATSNSGAASGSTASSGSTPTSGPASASSTTSTKATSTETSSGSVTVFTSSGSTFTSSTVPSTTSSAVGIDNAGSGNSHSGLSSAAKVGIGVGVGVGAMVLLATILAVFLRRRRRRRRASPKVESAGDDNRPVDTKPSEPPEPPKSEIPPVVPAAFDADGQPMAEADGRAAYPWTLRSELEGTQVERKEDPFPIAELPGSQNFARQPGEPESLAQEANRQIGPGWNGPSLRMLNSGAGKEYMQSSS